MKVEFKFAIDQSVTVEKTGFTGIVMTCAISGDPEKPETTYYIQGAADSGWYSERLLKEAK
jgi:hypothetical protein